MSDTILRFDGQDDFIELPATVMPLLLKADFTVEVWLFFPHETSSIGIAPIAENADEDSTQPFMGPIAGRHPILGVEAAFPEQGIRLAIDNGNVTMGFNGEGPLESTSQLLTTGRWYHIAWRYTKFTGEQAIFINGQISGHRRIKTALNNMDSLLVIGRWANEFMQGVIGELRIWGRAQNRLEIQANMSRVHNGQEPALAALWRLDEGQGTTASDSAGNHNGAIHGTTWTVETRKLPFRQDLPPKKVRGEAHSFLSKIRQHTAEQVRQTQAAAQQQKAAAHEKANQRLQKAHQDAVKKVNATKFEFIYFVAGGAIHRVNPAGVIEAIDLPNKSGAPGPPAHPRLVSDIAIDPAQNEIYWVESNPPFQINKQNLRNGVIEPIFGPLDGENPYITIEIDPVNEWIYWIGGTGRIFQISLDGSGNLIVPANITTAGKDNHWRLALDQGHPMLYWTDDNQIWRLNLDTQIPEVVVSNDVSPFPIAIAVDSESEKIFWIDKDLKMVRRANLDGSQAEDLYPSLHPSPGLVVDPGLKQIYWVAGHEDWEGDEPGLVSYWRFDEREGTQINDFTHNSNHGVIHGATWVVPESKPPIAREIHRVLQFDGIDDYIDIGASPHLYLNERITIEAWVKPEEKESGQATILSKGYRNFEFKIDDEGKLSLDLEADHHTDSIIETGQWMHLAATYDATVRQPQIKLYLNGRLVAEHSRDISIQNDDTPLQIGQRPIEEGMGFGHFKGEMAEIRLWNRARSEDEIRTSMKRYRAHYLMRGDMDGVRSPEKLFAIPPVTGLALLSKAVEEHEARLLAYRKRQQAREEAARKIDKAHAKAHKDVQDAHAELQRKHDEAAANITNAQTDAQNRRQEANQSLAASKTAAQRKRDQAQQAARERRQQAHQQADDVKADANNRARNLKKTAQDNLQRAKQERAKHQ